MRSRAWKDCRNYHPPSSDSLTFVYYHNMLLDVTRASFDIFTFHNESQNDQVKIVKSLVIKMNRRLTQSLAVRLFINGIMQDKLAFLVPKLSMGNSQAELVDFNCQVMLFETCALQEFQRHSTTSTDHSV